MIKAKHWSGEALPGRWLVTYKIDGVRALWNGERWMSRADKPLYNIPPHQPGDPTDCEVYLGSFKDTIRGTRTQHLKPDTPVVLREHLYGLDPLDRRLLGTLLSPNATVISIHAAMKDALAQGFEGLILRQDEKWIKVKPEATHDIAITGVIEGEGKHVGRLGALMTKMGNVGTGLTDEDRNELWQRHLSGEPLIGQIVEVSYMHLTDDGMFRHPRFVRMRPDKA